MRGAYDPNENRKGPKTHFVYQRGVPKTKSIVHRGTEQSSKDWIKKNAKHFIHKGKAFVIYKGKSKTVRPSDALDFKYVHEDLPGNAIGHGGVDMAPNMGPRFKTTDVTDKRYRKDRPPVVRRGFKAFLNDTEKK